MFQFSDLILYTNHITFSSSSAWLSDKLLLYSTTPTEIFFLAITTYIVFALTKWPVYEYSLLRCRTHQINCEWLLLHTLGTVAAAGLQQGWKSVAPPGQTVSTLNPKLLLCEWIIKWCVHKVMCLYSDVFQACPAWRRPQGMLEKLQQKSWKEGWFTTRR